MSSGLVIDNLSNQKHYLSLLSRWYHQAFSHLTDDLTLEQRRQYLNAHISGQPLPVSFVAIKNSRLLGGVCLVESDIESHVTYTPWLSRIFVREQARGQDVATALIQHAIAYIKKLGYRDLYLLTEHKQSFFSRFGFYEVDKAHLNGFELSIMVMNFDECN